MFIREPALIATTAYLSVSRHKHVTYPVVEHDIVQFIGGCLYMMFEAFPIVFEEGHHFKSSEIPLHVDAK